MLFTISLQKRYRTKSGAGFVQVGNVPSTGAADKWMQKHATEDVRAVASCGCVSYMTGSWERCGDHVSLG